MFTIRPSNPRKTIRLLRFLQITIPLMDLVLFACIAFHSHNQTTIPVLLAVAPSTLIVPIVILEMLIRKHKRRLMGNH